MDCKLDRPAARNASGLARREQEGAALRSRTHDPSRVVDGDRSNQLQTYGYIDDCVQVLRPQIAQPEGSVRREGARPSPALDALDHDRTPHLAIGTDRVRHLHWQRARDAAVPEIGADFVGGAKPRGDSAGALTATLNLVPGSVREKERAAELAVSSIIGAMPFVWVRVDDLPSAASLRGVIERNAIALLSNLGKVPIDSASPSWLGLHSSRERVRRSGLWNNNHVEAVYEPAFLDVLAKAASETTAL